MGLVITDNHRSIAAIDRTGKTKRSILYLASWDGSSKDIIVAMHLY
jgi:hypothetical protein